MQLVFVNKARLVCVKNARRFVGLVVLLFFALPLGLSVTGCGHKAAPVVYCYAGDSGPVVGQVAQITLSPSLATTGESLNYGQMGQALSATAQDCKGNAVSVRSFTYASTSSFGANTNGGPILADINPATGQVCGGTWNRNTGGGIADYTTCTPPSTAPPASKPIVLSVPESLPPTTTFPAVDPSPYTYSVTTAGLLTVNAVAGSTVSAITTTLKGATNTVSTGVPFFVVPSETVAVTYSLASQSPAPPTLTFAPAFAYTASAPGTIQVLGGTVSAIYDYVASSGAVILEPSRSGIIPVQPGDIVATFYTAAPTVIYTPAGVAALVTASANGATSNAIPIYVHPVATGVILGPRHKQLHRGSRQRLLPQRHRRNPCQRAPLRWQLLRVSESSGPARRACLSGRWHDRRRRPEHYLPGRPCNLWRTDLRHRIHRPERRRYCTTTRFHDDYCDHLSVLDSNQRGLFLHLPAGVDPAPGPELSFVKRINVAVNTLQPLTATVRDTNGNVITGLTLEYNSTTPQTIPAAVGSVTPAYPGSADITAVCQPANCNPSPFNQIGLYGNGKAITSNPITINTPGTSSTVLYMGSTSSDYLAFRDFTTNQTSALIKLPYVPNSMVMNQAGTAIYLGSPQGLMSFATATNTVSARKPTDPGHRLVCLARR